MDREKVIREIEDALSDNLAKAGHIYGLSLVGLKDKALTDALAMLKEQEWHMLTEDDDGIIHGLPGDDGQYLMTDGKDIWIDEYVDGVEDGIILDSGRDIREITAWMYMPELPKKDRR